MTARKWTAMKWRLMVAVGIVTGALAVVIANGVSANPTIPASSSDPGDVLGANPGNVVGVNAEVGSTTRTVVVDGVTWTVSAYSSPGGPCVGVVAYVDGVEQGRIGGGCGTADDPRLWWGIGGIEIAGQWFNIAYGVVTQAADAVRVTLGDGTVITDDGVTAADGVWIVVVPGDPLSQRSDVTTITALSAGSEVATETPPSIVAYRQQIESGVQREAAASG